MSTLSFITDTRPVSAANDRSRTGNQSLAVVGYRRSPEQCYFLESYERETEEPALLVMHLGGQYAGRLVPYRAPANENVLPVDRFTELAKLSRGLRPLKLAPRSMFSIQSRVVRRAALVVSTDQPPVRKYMVKVAIRSADQTLPARHHYVTTYHRPRVSLERVYSVPNRGKAIAVVSYIGMPFELGDRVEQPLLVETD